MNELITAIFDGTVFRPDVPVALPDRTRVRLVIRAVDDSTCSSDNPIDRLDELRNEASVDSEGNRLTREELHERRDINPELANRTSLISNLAQLRENLRQLQSYLDSADPKERSFAHELIRNGRCFVVTGEGDSRIFGPSRFVGYVNNSIAEHTRNDEKDGKETNPAISTVLNCPPEEDAVLEESYRQFCRQRNIAVRNYRTASRKYWRLDERDARGR